ncbi:alpha/beta hydrolase [Spongiactinospora sp. TRM90649]|uniref:alpha/beta hydrolase n=1 Tax=Spongiactinospora sp. TRM90649 TaxID=3031114 RepID=UPI0023F6D980|nr:alpha/beta hydrolase [Spongiactinospora sp. TRM90649]MDF5751929.1 alpha/beta hydrolase [Spongiactinospora sp. TRM90649]
MRRTVPLLAAALVALLALSPPAPASAAPQKSTAPQAPAQAITWTPCVRNPTAECGKVTVPVDWNDPGGPTIDLAVARRKAADPDARVGSLLLHPGGPGSSGISYALSLNDFSPELKRRFDIVGFDPRGVGESSPVVCSLKLVVELQDPLIKSQAEFDSMLDYSRRLREDCRARTGPVFDHIDSVSVARDLDAIRAALGEEKVTFYGLSYGSLVGQMYAELFPNRIRALVLDSNEDHSLRTGPYLYEWASFAQDSFDEFVKWCGAEARCALYGRDIRALWTRLLERADRGEVRNPSSPARPLTRQDLIRSVFRAGYVPTWYDLATLLAALDANAPNPPASASRLPAATPTAPEAQTAAQTATQPAADPEPALSYALPIFCKDFRWPIRDYREYTKHLRRAQAVAPDMGIVPTSLTLVAICLSEPDPIPNPQHRLKVKNGPPLLLVNGLHDPSTGYAWAVNVAAQIGKRARLLTYEGWGHDIYGRSDCINSTVDDYLIALKAPARGARCPAVPIGPPRTAADQPAPTPLTGFETGR